MSDSKELLLRTTRRTDPLGRVVIPIEMRRYINLEAEGLVDIELIGNTITLTKTANPERTTCLLCGKATPLLTKTLGFDICSDCVTVIVDVRTKNKAPSL